MAMTTTRARAITYGVAALLLAIAIRYTPRLSARDEAGDGSAAASRAEAPAAGGPISRTDTIGRGESLTAVLARGGVSEIVAREALRAASLLDPRRIPEGMPITVRSTHRDSVPTEIVLQLALDRFLHLKRTAGGWTEAEERLPWRTDTIVVSGEIRTTLYDAMAEAGRDLLPSSGRQQLTWTLADILEYRVDMSRDLQVGDRFRVLAERAVSPAGTVRAGKILAATFTLSGSTVEAVRFGGRSERGEYYDQQGKSLRAAFLRAPLEFRRISSVFGMRRHPILGRLKAHKGTDYAASSGTPVRAIGDGVVIKAGWGNGYGNVLEIRHRNGYVTRYGHLRGFARGVRPGTRVGIGQTVAYVGTTGLSTAPHLHFEVLVGGVQRDPRVALRDKTGFPIAASERAAFQVQRARMLATIEGHGIQLASARD